MLTAVIVSEHQDLLQYLRQVCAEFGDICIYKAFDAGTRRYEIGAALSAYEPDVAFVDVTDLDTPDSLAAACLQELLPRRLRTVLVPVRQQPPRELSARAAGAFPETILAPPFDAEQLERAVRDALRQRASKGASQVVAVFPAKPGDGASTVAINLAGAAAAVYQKKTLYIEGDLSSGAVCHLLNLQPRFPVSELFLSSATLMECWSSTVCASHGMDILPTGGSAQTLRGSRWDFYRLLRFAREQYELVVVDLPAAIDEVAGAIISEADAVAMICTPEWTSLGLISRRLRELEANGIRHGHLRVVVNRHAAGDAPAEELTRQVRREVGGLLPEDTKAARTAGRMNTLLDPDSVLQSGIVNLAGAMLQMEPPRQAGSLLGRLKRIVTPAARQHFQAGDHTSMNWHGEANNVLCDLRGRR